MPEAGQVLPESVAARRQRRRHRRRFVRVAVALRRAAHQRLLRLLVVDNEVGERQVDDGHYEGRYGDGHGVHQVHINLVHVQVADDQPRVHLAVVAGEIGSGPVVLLDEHAAVEHGRVAAALHVRVELGAEVKPARGVARQPRARLGLLLQLSRDVVIEVVVVADGPRDALGPALLLHYRLLHLGGTPELVIDADLCAVVHLFGAAFAAGAPRAVGSAFLPLGVHGLAQRGLGVELHENRGKGRVDDERHEEQEGEQAESSQEDEECRGIEEELLHERLRDDLRLFRHGSHDAAPGSRMPHSLHNLRHQTDNIRSLESKLKPLNIKN